MISHTDFMYRAAFEASRDAIVLIEDDRVIDCNEAAVEMFESVTKEGLLDSRPSDFSPSTQPDGRSSEELASTYMEEARARGSALFDWTHRTLRGRIFLTEVLLSRVGNSTMIQGVIRDISERRRTELELKQTNRQLEHFRTLVEDAIDQSHIGLFILDQEYRVVWASRPVEAFLGIKPAEAIGSDKRELARERIRPLLEDGERYATNTRIAYENDAHLTGRIYHVLPRGGLSERWLEHQSYPITSGVYAGGRIDIYRDLTERIRLEQELSHRATHDYLTGLLNRQQFEVLLEQEIARAARYGASPALVMFDVDRFKMINDNLGHDAGDEVLRQLSRSLKKWVRESDSLARWGGEEFTLLLTDCDMEDARRTAEKLRKQIQDIDFGPEINRLTISAGVTRHRGKETIHELLRRVDDALYNAKQKGRNRVVVTE